MCIASHTLTQLTTSIWLNKLAFMQMKHLTKLQITLIKDAFSLATEYKADA